MTELAFSHPDRPATEFRPFKAWQHFRKLIANKEDTEQVFHIMAALRGRKYQGIARRFSSVYSRLAIASCSARARACTPGCMAR